MNKISSLKKSRAVHGVVITSGLPITDIDKGQRNAQKFLEVLQAMESGDSFDVHGSKKETASVINAYRIVGNRHKISITSRRVSERGETENTVYRVWRI